MDISTDVAIIGNGLAAYAAALELQGTGLEVTVVAKAPGASALNSGAWDVADNPVRVRGDPWRGVSIEKNVGEILRREDFHPYTVLARHTPPGGFFEFLWTRMVRAAEALPLAMHQRDGQNLMMPADLGTLKPTAFVQASMAQADLAMMERAKILMVGIRGYPQFNARFVRASLLAHQEEQPSLHVEFAGHLDVECPGIVSKSSLTGIEIAQALEEESAVIPFAQSIAQYLEGKVYTHLFLPPVLGVEKTPAIVEALRGVTGLQVAETLATPMSVPGWRLHHAIQNFFDKKGVKRIEGEVVGYDCQGPTLKSLRIHDREKRIRLNARRFILASGKFIGGGVARQGRFLEPIFHLPLTFRGSNLSDQSVLRASRPEARRTQPYLGVGVAIGPLGQPVNAEGQVVFDNLHAAGAILADFDPSHDRSAAGVAIASGAIAGHGAKSGI